MSNSPTTPRRDLKPLVSGAFGNFVEWYDWGIFAVFAAVFADQIFPAHSDTASLLSTLVTFAVGFAARPLGAVLLSPLGDKIGRKRLLGLTILMMGGGSLLISVTPTYDTIGVLAPALFVIARITQGISAGAEFQSGSNYVVEHAPAHRRGLYGSSTLVSSILGTLLATGTGALLTAVLPEVQLTAWGWRVPFLLGAVLGAFGLFLRLRAPETPAFESLTRNENIEQTPLRTVFARHKTAMLRLFAIAVYTSPYYLWTVYLPTYAHLSSGLPLSQTFVGGIISLVLMMLALPAVGALSDRYGRKPMLLVTPIGMALLAYPFLRLLENADFTTFLLVDIAGCLLISFTSGTMSATFCELFPAEIRTTGIGIPYNIASALLGGTTPLIATALTASGHGAALALLIIPLSLFSVLVLARMPAVTARPLDDKVPAERVTT
ncbi:MFS transporter [Streptomyces sp. SID8361]|uniref:MFS transporter n=1 Tax=Streptomyces sp. MnatMP-M27 TaxID=1839768 RepID=UPI00081D7D8F|nr:MFS transporter [Streptomyces sp. MnatMP-M27]MYU15744.1 MFS transporter [Streptomyces sp. SID8361]SCG10212.1 MFS transporter, MHS family, alpha-ketoglutarate permease [Streptomyces sp. MnatMP-M27]